MTAHPLIVGAGPAGCAAAIAMCHAGAKPLIVEKSTTTKDALCGGFLSWRTLDQLETLGIATGDLGGQIIRRVRLFAGDTVAQAMLPEPGIGLSRRALDDVMQGEAVRCGATMRRKVTVRGVESGAVALAGGEGLAADAIFLACGKQALAGQPRQPPGRASRDPALGLRLRLPPSPVLDRLIDDAVELFLFDGGYAGLVRQQGGYGNLAIATHKSRLAQAGGDPVQLIARWAEQSPALADRLGRGWATSTIDAIGSVPYGWMARVGTPGLWRLGDQAAVIPSLAGEGMGIAIASALSAVKAWRAGEDSARWQAGFARRINRPMQLARLIWRMAETPGINRMGVTALGLSPALLRLVSRLTRVDG